jgi:hypothetical protein
MMFRFLKFLSRRRSVRWAGKKVAKHVGRRVARHPRAQATILKATNHPAAPYVRKGAELAYIGAILFFTGRGIFRMARHSFGLISSITRRNG